MDSPSSSSYQQIPTRTPTPTPSPSPPHFTPNVKDENNGNPDHVDVDENVSMSDKILLPSMYDDNDKNRDDDAHDHDEDVNDPFDVDSPSFPPHTRRYLSISVFLVVSSIFLDGLLFSLPLSFLSILLDNNGVSSFYIGMFYAIKPAVQITCNPLIGYINNNIGPAFPLCLSALSICISCVIFGVVNIEQGTNFFIYLCFARAIQGVGTATAFSSGFMHIASIYKSDEKRGEKLSMALGMSGLSVLVAPPIGSVLYHFFDEHTPFWVCCVLSGAQFIGLFYIFFVDKTIHNFEISSGIQEERKNRPSYFSQLSPLFDTQIIILLLLQLTLNLGMAGVEFLLPIYLSDHFNCSSLIVGLIFIPCTIGYTITTPVVGKLAGRWGRFLLLTIGTFFQSVGLFTFPLAPTWWFALMSLTPMGVALGMIDGSYSTVMAHLVDKRHGRGKGYGIIYSATDVAVQLGFLIGSLGGAFGEEEFGLFATMFAWGILSLAFVPLLVWIKSKGIDEEIKKEYSEKERKEKEREERKKAKEAIKEFRSDEIKENPTDHTLNISSSSSSVSVFPLLADPNHQDSYLSTHSPYHHPHEESKSIN